VSVVSQLVYNFSGWPPPGEIPRSMCSHNTGLPRFKTSSLAPWQKVPHSANLVEAEEPVWVVVHIAYRSETLSPYPHPIEIDAIGWAQHLETNLDLNSRRVTSISLHSLRNHCIFY